MEVQVGIPKLLSMSAKFVSHKVQQYRLSTNESAVVSTKYGQVRGLQRKTVYDEELYYSFEGIPYAKPPRGELRFRAPQPPEPWDTVRDCTRVRAKPLQRNMVIGLMEGSENCLHLNVYSKTLRSDRPLPVIVWIYGGGFQKGEATRDIYSPDYFMKQQVVLVCINYRLGALGFLSLKDPKLDVPGNAGLKDQVLALRWINQNIASFNGDPNNITVMGESAGAASTHIMMITEKTRGLFHKAILQSGCALSEWVDSPDHNWAFRLASHIGYTGSKKEEDVLEFLEKAPARDIANADQEILEQDEMRHFLLFAFGPVVEPYHTEHCVVPKPHKEMLETAWGNNIPIIIGANSFEGLFSYQLVRNDPWALVNFENILPRSIRQASSPEKIEELVSRLKKEYLGDENRKEMDLFEALYIFGHRQIWHDVHRTLLARLAYAPTRPTYLYRFDFDSPYFNQYRRLVCGNHIRGVAHADELSYLFYNIVATKLNKNTLEYRTIERMIGMWTTFAASGNPNCPASAPKQWTPITSDAPHSCFNISDSLDLIELPEGESMTVWDSLYPKEALY